VLGYGLDFLFGLWLLLLGMLSLERGTLPFDCWSASRIILSFKVKGARWWPLCLWLGDNIAIFSMVKTSTSL